MHDLPTTLGGTTHPAPGDGDAATAEEAVDADLEPVLPARPVTPLMQLGAPVVGDLEPATAPAVEPSPEPIVQDGAATQDAPTDSRQANDLLRRAALLRLVGLGRSRLIR